MTDARTKTTIRIDNIHQSLTQQNVHDYFIAFGEIINVELSILNERDGTHNGTAHIEYEDPIDAAAAIDNMNHAELYETVIRVAQAAPLRESFEGLGSKVPLWEQEGFIQQYLVKHDDDDNNENAMVGLEREANSIAQQDLPVSVGPIQVKQD